MSQRISSKLIGVIVTGALFCTPGAFASTVFSTEHVCVTDAIQKDNRPEPDKRLFRSQAVENEIVRVQKLLKNARLAWMFTNCFPNTLDTTVHFREGSDGKPELLSIPVIYTRCGFVTPELRYGLMYNWPIRTRN